MNALRIEALGRRSIASLQDPPSRSNMDNKCDLLAFENCLLLLKFMTMTEESTCSHVFDALEMTKIEVDHRHEKGYHCR